MKKHIWWSFSVADASFLCLSSGVSSRLVPPTWEDHHPQKIGGVHWHHGNGQWGWDLGGNKFGSSSLWRGFFFPSRWKCLTKTKMADWISMTWPGTVRIVSLSGTNECFYTLFAATPAVLFHGGDTGEGVRMGNREGHTTWHTTDDKNCISSTEGASTFWGGWPLPPLGGTPVTLLVIFFVLIDQPLCVLLFLWPCLSRFWVSLWCFYMFFYFVFIFYCSALKYFLFLSLHPDRITHKSLWGIENIYWILSYFYLTKICFFSPEFWP